MEISRPGCVREETDLRSYFASNWSAYNAWVSELASGVRIQESEKEYSPFATSHPGLNGTVVVGIVFFLISMAFILTAPYILLLTYKGKV